MKSLAKRKRPCFAAVKIGHEHSCSVVAIHPRLANILMQACDDMQTHVVVRQPVCITLRSLQDMYFVHVALSSLTQSIPNIDGVLGTTRVLDFFVCPVEASAQQKDFLGVPLQQVTAERLGAGSLLIE